MGKLMKVTYKEKFKEKLKYFAVADQLKIKAFVEHVEIHGLKGLAGRNKSSVPENPHTKKQQENAKYAQKYCLCHYHIGIPEYVGEYGDMTSEYILHYQRFDEEIVLVDISIHPPFILPSLDNLKV